MNSVQFSIRFAVWTLLVLALNAIFQPLNQGVEIRLLEEHLFDIGGDVPGLLVRLAFVLVIPTIISHSIFVLPQWERIAILRLGRFERVAGPGMFFVPPFLWSAEGPVSIKLQTETVKAARTPTKNKVPVDIEIVLYFKVVDAKLALLEVEDFYEATIEAAQGALRPVVSSNDLDEVLTNREALAVALKTIADERCARWGVDVESIMIKDIVMPPELQDAMSRRAQAEQESQASEALALGEKLAADGFVKAAETYARNPVALDLRKLAVLREIGLNAQSAVFLPSSLPESASTAAAIAQTMTHPSN